MSVQPFSAEVLPSKHWHLSSLPQQRSFPVSIAVCPAFLNRRAPRKHCCLSSLPQQRNFPLGIDICPAFISRELPVTLVSVQPSSVEELGVGLDFLSRRASQLALVSIQPSSAKELPVSIGVCPAFLSRKAPGKHWYQRSNWERRRQPLRGPPYK